MTIKHKLRLVSESDPVSLKWTWVHGILIVGRLNYSISQEICTRFLLCCGFTLTDFPISIRLTSLALWQSNDCPSASKATLMNMDKNFMWIHYERLHNHNKAKHNKTVCIFLGIYCMFVANQPPQYREQLIHDITLLQEARKKIIVSDTFEYICNSLFI